MWGDQDLCRKPESTNTLATAIPHAVLVWVKDASHWLIEEKPGEIDNRIKQLLGG